MYVSGSVSTYLSICTICIYTLQLCTFVAHTRTLHTTGVGRREQRSFLKGGYFIINYREIEELRGMYLLLNVLQKKKKVGLMPGLPKENENYLSFLLFSIPSAFNYLFCQFFLSVFQLCFYAAFRKEQGYACFLPCKWAESKHGFST